MIRKIITHCTDEYSIFNYDNNNYTLKWQTYFNKSSVETDPEYDQVYNAFKYQSALKQGTFPYSGIYTTYLGGGYIFDFFGGNVSQLQSYFSALQANNWVDRNTRGLILEMSLYNVNVKLFAYATMLFEVLPTGNWIQSVRVDPLNLSDVSQDVGSLKTLANIIYLGFIVFFMIRELNKLRKANPRIVYLKNFWNWVELAVIACSWASFSMYIYRMYAVSAMLKKLKTYTSSTQIRLDSIKVIYLILLNNLFGIFFI